MSVHKIPGFRFFRNADGGGGGGDAGAGDGGGDAAAAAAAAKGGDAGAGGGDNGGGEGDKGASQFTVPEAYKDRAWTKEIKSVDDLFKSYDNATQLLGKPKIGVPSDKATPEEKATFYKELGVPENPDGYEFKKPDTVPDEMWNSENEKKWAGLMKENNVPKGVANALRDAMINETLEIHNASIKTLNEALDKSFGDKKLAVTKEVGDIMQKAVPDAALRAEIEKNIGSKNTPAFALALAHVVGHFKKEYGLADTNTGDQDTNSTGKTIPEMRAEAQALMKSEAYTNAMHKDHAATRKQVDGMYADIGKLTDAAKKVK